MIFQSGRAHRRFWGTLKKKSSNNVAKIWEKLKNTCSIWFQCISQIDFSGNTRKPIFWYLKHHYTFQCDLISILQFSWIRGLCLMTCSSTMLQNLSYFWNTKIDVDFFISCYLIFSANECPGLCRHRQGHSLRGKN